MKFAIRQSQKINSRIHDSRIAIRQRIAQLGLHVCKLYGYLYVPMIYYECMYVCMSNRHCLLSVCMYV